MRITFPARLRALRNAMRPGALPFSALLVVACNAADTSHEEGSPAADRAFDALSAAEITTAVAGARRQPSVPPAARIVSVWLEEPDKDSVLAGRATPRAARVVTYDATRGETVETLIDLAGGTSLDSRRIAGVQPMLSANDSERADAIARADPRWRAALIRRGLSDPGVVVGAAWSAGYFGDSTETGRLVRVVPYLREGGTDPAFLRPIEGIMATVDLTQGRVTAMIDDAVVPVPATRGFTSDVDDEEAAGGTGGASAAATGAIVVQGGAIRWRNWRLHVAPHPREGVVLHRVRYADGGRDRSMLYRASVSEMVVPYGDPDRGWFVRNAIDAGEFGLGSFDLPLREGIDVPAGAQFLDATIADESGRPIKRPRAVALYERDGGLAWRYRDVGRRARELVVEWVSSVGNYEYAFAWIFHEDGVIEQRTTLTGIMSVKGAQHRSAGDVAGSEAHGGRVSDVLVAPHHQHFFAFRLDTDVDGANGQRVLEVDGAHTAAGDVHGSDAAMTAATTPLLTEGSARRHVSGATARRWAVENTSARNAIGGAVALSLLPGENARPLAGTSAWIRKRAGFIDAQLWVTPYRRNQLYAAGDYPNQSRGGDGLPAFTRGDASVANADVVLWYVMGVTHLPRTEDWPVMPSHVAGFRLAPTGFFSANPLTRVTGAP